MRNFLGLFRSRRSAEVGSRTAAPPHDGSARGFAIVAVVELRKVVDSLLDKVKGSGPSRMCLSSLKPLLSRVHERLEEIGGSGKRPRGLYIEESILELLDGLESLVTAPNERKRNSSGPFSTNNYKQLAEIVSGSGEEAKKRMRKLFESKHKKAAEKRTNLNRLFADFANSRPAPQDLPLSELVENDDRSAGQDRDMFSDCSSQLHATLCRCSSDADETGEGFTANIALTRVPRGTSHANDEVLFDCLFFHLHPAETRLGNMWKNTRIRVVHGDSDQFRPPPKVRFTKPNPPTTEDFCDMVCARAYGRHEYRVTSHKLIFERNSLDTKEPVLLDESSISLATILKEHKLPGDKALKMLLSYLLAKGVWGFYDSDWMTPQWTKDAIHFMRESPMSETTGSRRKPTGTRIQKPYINFRLPRASSLLDIGKKPEEVSYLSTHHQPKILKLGIMLLEIQLGEGLEGYKSENLCNHSEEVANEDHYAAALFIEHSSKWKQLDTVRALKEMIHKCIMDDWDDETARDVLYSHVVAPLCKLCRLFWPKHEGGFETCNPGPIHLGLTELLPGSTKSCRLELTSEVNNTDLGQVSGQQPSPRRVTSARAEPELSSGEGRELRPEECRRDKETPRQKATDKWLKDFQTLFARYGIRGRSSKERIKVAVLDSGINIDSFGDMVKEERIKATRSFIESDPKRDQTGHGTHIAAIIFQLASNVDLYIGQVTNSTELINREKEIVEAIDTAREEWEVDMISLSFGFRKVGHPDRIGDAIKKCIDREIVIFASASNDGGDSVRTFPASYPNVICVHASEFQGGSWDMNPPTEPEDANDKFSFVGVDVRPSRRSNTAGGEAGMEYKTGTSFATAVAVSVAAFMIGYIRKEMKGYTWRVEPCSPDGIRTIFQRMAKSIGDYDWVSPIRHFNRNSEELIQAELKQYLGYT